MNWKLTDNKNWDSLEQQFRWVQDMNFVMQHHLHHEEGSVAVHTRLHRNRKYCGRQLYFMMWRNVLLL